MLQQPLKVGQAWRNTEPVRRRNRGHVRLTKAGVAGYLAYLEQTEPPDRLGQDHLDDLRIDGHVWIREVERDYRSHPRGRVWTDEEEQELHREEEARERERQESAFEFVVWSSNGIVTAKEH